MTRTIPEHPIVPDRVKIEPYHLSVTHEFDSGFDHKVHLSSNPELNLILSAGERECPAAPNVPHNVGDTGVVIVSLGVDDGDHDDVQFTSRGDVETEELLAQAIEALMMCRDAVRGISRI